MTDFDQTPLTDDAMDQLLRDAGARMRATAPGTVTPSPHRHEHRRNRWIIPVTLGAVAAAIIAIVVGLARDPEESISNVPADTLPPTVPVTTTPPSVTPTTVTPTTTPDGSDSGSASSAVSQQGWDGDGSACVTLDGLTGCFPGRRITPEPTFAFVKNGDTVQFVTVTTSAQAGVEVAVEPSNMECELPDPDGWYVDVICGPNPLVYGTLPAEPVGDVSYGTFRTETGEPVALELLQAGSPAGPDDTAPSFWSFVGTVELGGVDMRCWLVIPSGSSARFESCLEASVDRPADSIGAFVWSGAAYGLLADGSVVDVSTAVPWSNGCTDPLAALIAEQPAEMVISNSYACDGDSGSSSFGPVFISFGPPDGGLTTYERNELGVWVLTDSGTGIEPDPSPLPLPPVDVMQRDENDLPPVDVTAEVAAVAGSGTIEEITDRLLADASTGEGRPPQVTTFELGSPLLIVDVTYLDDSIGTGRLAVWLAADPADPENSVTVDSAFRMDRCSRGITDDNLCV